MASPCHLHNQLVVWKVTRIARSSFIREEPCGLDGRHRVGVVLDISSTSSLMIPWEVVARWRGGLQTSAHGCSR